MFAVSPPYVFLKIHVQPQELAGNIQPPKKKRTKHATSQIYGNSVNPAVPSYTAPSHADAAEVESSSQSINKYGLRSIGSNGTFYICTGVVPADLVSQRAYPPLCQRGVPASQRHRGLTVKAN